MVRANPPPETTPPPSHPPARPLPLIAVVDDEPDILELVAMHLQKAGFQVAALADANQLYRLLEHKTPNLIVLDLMLPDVDGIDVCRFLRQDPRWSAIPIIMVTARTEETDRILGLEIGADDYITKPFSPRELVARVRTVLRRRERQTEAETFTVGEIITIDPKSHEVTVAGSKVNLTTTEFRILLLLAQHPGWVFTRTQILNELWGEEKAVLDRTIDVHIRNLRVKLGKAGNLIVNVRGVGYKIQT